MNNLILILVTLLFLAKGLAITAPTAYHAWHVTVNGTATGSGIDSLHAQNLAAAISASTTRAAAGDTIYVHGGTYTGDPSAAADFVSTLAGTSANPIIVRNYNNQRVILQGNHNGSNHSVLGISGNYSWFWGLDFSEIGYDTYGGNHIWTGAGATGNKIINCFFKNSLGNAISNFEDDRLEIVGNVMVYNGRFLNGGGEAYAYNIYTHQNGSNRPKHYVRDNIMLNSWGYGVHEYTIGTGNDIDSICWIGNSLAQAGWAAENRRWGFFVGSSTGGIVANGNVYDSNYVYFDPTWAAKGIVTWGADGLRITNNVFAVAGGYATYFDSPPRNLTFSGNILVGTNSQTGSGNTIYSSWPSRTADVFIRKNPYEPKRANITIYNWQSASSVSIDPSSILAVGDPYQVRDPLNWWGNPIASGTYTGGTISIPMTGLTVENALGADSGTRAGRHTTPYYGAFVLIGQGTGVIPPPTYPPRASTNAATLITRTTATLNGTVNPNTLTTIVRFLWGTVSGTYTDSVAIASQTGTGDRAVSRAVTGLAQGTTYYFRVRAYNADGGVQGGQLNFTTSLAIPSIPTLTFPTNNASVQPPSVTVSWNSVGGAQTYRLQVSTDTQFASRLVDDSTITATSYQLNSLANTTNYFWRVRAKNSGGVSGFSAAWSFVTGVASPQAKGEQDVTLQGTIAAQVTQPKGSGSRSLEVIRDGVTPPIGVSDPLKQYDTYDPSFIRSFDWVGYEFASSHSFTHVTFQEGLHYAGGGYIDSVQVQVRAAGVWNDVADLVCSPPYSGSDGINYEVFDLTFLPITGDGIRLGGSMKSTSGFLSVGELRVFEQTANVVTDAPSALSFRLEQNFPNPFNPKTQITYTLPVGANVLLKVHNLLGQVVATLADGYESDGTHVKHFDASRLASGMYLYSLVSGRYREIRRMVLLK